MPTRFKYAKTAPQTFGLSAVEILMATDAELNQYMGIKKYAPYRKNTQNWDKNRATRLKDLRTKIATRRSAVDGGDAAAAAIAALLVPGTRPPSWCTYGMRGGSG